MNKQDALSLWNEATGEAETGIDPLLVEFAEKCWQAGRASQAERIDDLSALNERDAQVLEEAAAALREDTYSHTARSHELLRRMAAEKRG